MKFKDADLIGIPYRITIGKKLAQGMVEVVDRRTKQSADVPLAEAAEYVQQTRSTAAPDWEAVRAEFPALAELDLPQHRNLRATAETQRASRRPITLRGGTRLHARISSSGSTMRTRFATSIARLINCEPADIAFITNAATALSLLMSGIEWKTGRSGAHSGARISE